MEIEPTQFMILCCAAVPLALAARFGFVDYAGLDPLQALAVAVPFMTLALALAFVRIPGRYQHYLYMTLAEKLPDNKSKQTVADEEDERD